MDVRLIGIVPVTQTRNGREREPLPNRNQGPTSLHTIIGSTSSTKSLMAIEKHKTVRA